MKTGISKYFSLILLLFLVNSNFSFALTQMMCSMNMADDVCECKDNSKADDIQFNTPESGCCKTNIKEINNSNILENTVSKVTKSIISLNTIHYQEVSIRPETYTCFIIIHNTFKPPKDLPVLYSSLLI
ncbi:MAG: hypothetical protein JST15_11505 [Bacteroidetes bacterium]|nr:hypothetical protein [Bacteroidota bacterium]